MRLPAQQQRNAVAACSPGGLGRQFRVQYRDTEQSDYWCFAASFATRQQAEGCMAQLRAKGRIARVVHFSKCPAAG